MRLYKKISNRSLSLVFIQSWYLSDRYGLYDITDGEMFFEPLFIHEDGKGVGIYYDFTDPKQDPKHLLPYFKTNYDKFIEAVKSYELDCKEIIKLTADNSVQDFAKVYGLIMKTWPVLAICDVLGAMTADEQYSDIIKLAYNARVKNDQAVYRAEEYLSEIIRSSFEFKDKALADLVFPEEFIEERIPSLEELNIRKHGYIYFAGKMNSIISISEFCREYDIELEMNDLSTKATILKGSIACKGKVTGRAVLVFEKSQMDKVQDGDILVMPMTTPDFLSVMKKAAAFITDEGGITCHAAIVAREMGKPCIIGTKIATQVLQDGDLVEVDAEKGVVTIINR